MEGREDKKKGGGAAAAGSSAPGSRFKNLVSREYYSHKKKVHSVAWNCTGTKLASGSIDHGARVWSIDPHGHSKVKDIELKGHTDSVDQLCWDPKHPKTVATAAAADKTIRLWDARSGKCQVVELSGENINITYKHDGTHIAVGNKEMVKKCYVVYIGQVPGVYEEWKDCQKQVNNFSGNNYQGYESREVTEEKWRRHGRKKWRNFLVITTLLLFMVGYVFYFI